MDKELLVQNIKKYCEMKGVNPTVACRESGAGRSFMTNLEVKGSIPSVEKVKYIADYLGVTTSELLGEPLPTGPAADKAQLQAAFWGGDQDLTQEEKDAMWNDVERFAAFLAQQKKQEKQQNDDTP